MPVPSSKHLFRAACAALCLSAALAPALAEEGVETRVAPATVTVADLGWIAGDWHGTMGESEVEEIWSEPAADTMMAMFRWHGGGKIRLYEFMAIEATDAGPVLRLKHFSHGLRGWEEKDDSLAFKLIEAAGQRAVFRYETETETTDLVYERDGDGLTVTLHKRVGDKETTTVFPYRRR